MAAGSSRQAAMSSWVLRSGEEAEDAGVLLVGAARQLRGEGRVEGAVGERGVWGEESEARQTMWRC